MIKKLRLKCHSLTSSSSGYTLPDDVVAVGGGCRRDVKESGGRSATSEPNSRHSNVEVTLTEADGQPVSAQLVGYYDPLQDGNVNGLGTRREIEGMRMKMRRPTRLCYSDDDAASGEAQHCDLSKSMKSASLNEGSDARRRRGGGRSRRADSSAEEEAEEEEDTHMSWIEIMAKKRELEKSLGSKRAGEEEVAGLGKASVSQQSKSKRSSFFSPSKLRDLFTLNGSQSCSGTSTAGASEPKKSKIRSSYGLVLCPSLKGRGLSARRSSGLSNDPSPVLFDLRSRGLPAIPVQDFEAPTSAQAHSDDSAEAARESFHLCRSWDRGSGGVDPARNSGDFFIDSFNELKNKGWYWGPLSWKEAEEQLKDKPTGSFLVRDSSDDRYILSLTFKSEDKIHHTRIEHYRGQFSFNNQPKSLGAATIVEFIEKAIENCADGSFSYFLRPRGPGVPPTMFRLVRPVSRFTRVHSLQHMCRFVILSRIRRDMIERLPVPTLVKKYLACPQYYFE